MWVTDLRLLPSDPRYAAYNELQQTLTLAMNTHCHYNLRNMPVDPLVWNVERDRLCDAVRGEMRLMRDGAHG